MSIGLPRPGLAPSAHRGRIKLLRGYIFKSSAALNPLTITQLACESQVYTRSRTALCGPAHELAARMGIIITTHPNNQPCANNRAEGLHFSAFHSSFYTFQYNQSTLFWRGGRGGRGERGRWKGVRARVRKGGRGCDSERW